MTENLDAAQPVAHWSANRRSRMLLQAAQAGDVERCWELCLKSWAVELDLGRVWGARLAAGLLECRPAADDPHWDPLRIAPDAAPLTREVWSTGIATVSEDPHEWDDLTDEAIIIAPIVGPDGPLGVLIGEWIGRDVTASQLSLATLAAEHVALSLTMAERAASDAQIVSLLGQRVEQLDALVSRDQRKKRMADEASDILRRSTHRLHAVIDQLPQALVIARAPDGQVTLANPVASQMLGAQPGQRLTVALRAPDGAPLPVDRLPLDRALRGEVCSPEEVVVTSGGRPRHLLLTATPVPTNNKHVEEALLVAQDITPLKEIDRLKSEIISLVSHELRTPLHHIKGFSSTLLTPELVLDEATRQDLLQSIDEETNRLIHMVTDLLDLARLEAGAVERAEKQQVEPIALLEQAVERFRGLNRDSLVEIRVTTPLTTLAVDRDRIERVVINLLANAVKVQPENVPILITAEDCKSTGEVTKASGLLVRVIDRGPGVPLDERERVFERFYRGRNAVGSGVGLGLSICKAIVEGHGGKIWVEETPGGGASFAFCLYAAPLPAQPRV